MSDYEFTIPLAPSINGYRASVRNRLITSKKGREYQKAVKDRMDELGLSNEGIDKRVVIGLTIHHKMKINYDVSNYLKAYEDSLVKCGFIVDDHLIEYSHIRKGEKIAGGLMKLTINILED